MIKIKGIDYRVVPSVGSAATEGIVMLGYINYFDSTIDLRVDANPKVVEETLLHEIIHGLTLNERGFTEAMVDRLSRDLYAVLTDNGLLKEGWIDKIIDNEEEMGKIDDDDSVRAVDRPTPISLAR